MQGLNHTVGPWIAQGCDIKPLGNQPPICWTGIPDRNLSEARANAMLIAASPELLAALELLLEETEQTSAYQDMLAGEDYFLAVAVEKARSAIDKAKGN